MDGRFVGLFLSIKIMKMATAADEENFHEIKKKILVSRRISLMQFLIGDVGIT